MKKAIVVSRADYPIVIKIGSESKVVSPRERFTMYVSDDTNLKEILHPELKVQIEE